MSPHAQHLDNTFLSDHLIDETVLNVDAAGACAAQVAEQLFKRQQPPKMVSSQDAEEQFCLRTESRRGEIDRLNWPILIV